MIDDKRYKQFSKTKFCFGKPHFCNIQSAAFVQEGSYLCQTMQNELENDTLITK